MDKTHPLLELSKRVKREQSKSVASPNALDNLKSDYAPDGEYWKSINSKL